MVESSVLSSNKDASSIINSAAHHFWGETKNGRTLSLVVKSNGCRSSCSLMQVESEHLKALKGIVDAFLLMLYFLHILSSKMY